MCRNIYFWNRWDSLNFRYYLNVWRHMLNIVLMRNFSYRWKCGICPTVPTEPVPCTTGRMVAIWTSTPVGPLVLVDSLRESPFRSMWTRVHWRAGLQIPTILIHIHRQMGILAFSAFGLPVAIPCLLPRALVLLSPPLFMVRLLFWLIIRGEGRRVNDVLKCFLLSSSGCVAALPVGLGSVSSCSLSNSLHREPIPLKARGGLCHFEWDKIRSVMATMVQLETYRLNFIYQIS